MSEHRFELPEAMTTGWETISQQAQDSLADARNVPDLAGNLYGETLLELSGESPEVTDWLLDNMESAIAGWERYGNKVSFGPSDLNALFDRLREKEGGEFVTRLYQAQQDIKATGEKMPKKDALAGDVMRLVLMPWQDMKDNLPKFEDWVQRMRESLPGWGYYINPNLTQAIQTGLPVYRNPQAIHKAINAQEYLDQKIAQDGPWGVMLAQYGAYQGTRSWEESGLDTVMWAGAGANGHAQLGGHNVDAMGVFEWLAMTFQSTDLSGLETQKISWLPANNVHMSNSILIPYTEIIKNSVHVVTSAAGTITMKATFRLAVA